MSDHRHPFADERFSERWPSAAQWSDRQRRGGESRRRRVAAGAHEGARPRGNPEVEEDKVRPRSEEFERVLGH